MFTAIIILLGCFGHAQNILYVSYLSSSSEYRISHANGDVVLKTLLQADDSPFEEVALPFQFNYFGSASSSVFVSPNGAIHFSALQPCQCSCFGSYDCDFNRSYHGVIAGFLADLNPSSFAGSNATYSVVSESEVMFTFTSFPFYSFPKIFNSFRILLSNDGSARVFYDNINPQVLLEPNSGEWISGLRKPSNFSKTIISSAQEDVARQEWRTWVPGIYPSKSKIVNGSAFTACPISTLWCSFPSIISVYPSNSTSASAFEFSHPKLLLSPASFSCKESIEVAVAAMGTESVSPCSKTFNSSIIHNNVEQSTTGTSVSFLCPVVPILNNNSAVMGLKEESPVMLSLQVLWRPRGEESFTALESIVIKLNVEAVGNVSDFTDRNDSCILSSSSSASAGCLSSSCDVCNHDLSCLSLPCNELPINSTSPVPVLYQYPARNDYGYCANSTFQVSHEGSTFPVCRADIVGSSVGSGCCSPHQTDCNGQCWGKATVAKVALDSNMIICCLSGKVDCAGICDGKTVVDVCGNCNGNDFNGVGCFSVKQSSLQRGAPWPSIARNELNQGVSPFAVNLTRQAGVQGLFDAPTVRWNVSLDGSALAPPVLGVDGTLYVGSAKGTMFAVTSLTGKVRLQFETAESGKGGIVSAGVIDNLNRLYFGTLANVLYCLDAMTFSVYWKYRASAPLIAAPLVYGDKVYFTTKSNNIYAVNRATGSTVFSKSMSRVEYFDTTPVVGPKTFYLLSRFYFVGFLSESGDVVSYESLSRSYTDVKYVTRLGDGTILYCTDNSKTLRRFFPTSYQFRSVITFPFSIYGNMAVEYPSTVFLCTQDNMLYALDASQSNRILWQQILSVPCVSPILYANEVLVVSGSVAVNKTSGQFLSELLSTKMSFASGFAVGADGSMFTTNSAYLAQVRWESYQSCPSGYGVKNLQSTASFNYSDCEKCATGTTSAQSLCSMCSPGTYMSFSKAAASACRQCPAGSYSANYGSTSCSVCPAGAFSSPGMSSCEDCPPGTFNPVKNSSVCLSCPVGKYSSEFGSVQCTACPAGSYSDSIGRSGCQFCKAGTFSGSNGSSSCQVCSAGSYSSTYNSTSCSKCYGVVDEKRMSCGPCSVLAGWSKTCDAFIVFGSPIIGHFVGFGVSLLMLSLFAVGVLTIREVTDITSGIIVTKLGVFLFLLVPTLETLLLFWYAVTETFDNMNIMGILFVTLLFHLFVGYATLLVSIGIPPWKYSCRLLVSGLFFYQTKCFASAVIWNKWIESVLGNPSRNVVTPVQLQFVNDALFYELTLHSIPILIILAFLSTHGLQLFGKIVVTIVGYDIASMLWRYWYHAEHRIRDQPLVLQLFPSWVLLCVYETETPRRQIHPLPLEEAMVAVPSAANDAAIPNVELIDFFVPDAVVVSCDASESGGADLTGAEPTAVQVRQYVRARPYNGMNRLSRAQVVEVALVPSNNDA